MKKLLLMGLVWTCAHGMQAPLSGAKRIEPEELSEGELPDSSEKIQRIEEIWDVTKKRAAQLSVIEKDILLKSLDAAENQLWISDLKNIVEQSPAKAYTPGGTQRAKLFNAAQNIKNVFLSHKLLIPLLTDKQLAGQIITRLAQAYQASAPLAALALNTDAASAWIGEQLNDAKKMRPELFYILLEAAEQKNREPFDFFFKHAGQNAGEVMNKDFDGINPLSIAVRNNDIKLVEHLLAIPGIKLNIPLVDGGVTNIMYAAYHGNNEVLKKLIQAGADLNLQSVDGDTALIFATEQKRPEAIQALIDAGADFNVPNKKGITALMIATAVPELLTKLVQAHPDLNLQSQNGNTALLWAVQTNKTESVQILIDAGADVNLPNVNAITPLMLAIITNNQDIINKLIPVSRVTLRDNYEYNALDYAVINRNSEAVHALLRGELRNLMNEYDSEHNNPLIKAVKNADLETVEELLGAGARLDVSDQEGKAPLALAVSNNNPEVTQALIKARANLNAQNLLGNTALMIAAEIGNRALVEMLIAAGAQLTMKNNAGETAYDIAAKKGHTEIMQKLQVHEGRS